MLNFIKYSLKNKITSLYKNNSECRTMWEPKPQRNSVVYKLQLERSRKLRNFAYNAQRITEEEANAAWKTFPIVSYSYFFLNSLYRKDKRKYDKRSTVGLNEFIFLPGVKFVFDHEFRRKRERITEVLTVGANNDFLRKPILRRAEDIRHVIMQSGAGKQKREASQSLWVTSKNSAKSFIRWKEKKQTKQYGQENRPIFNVQKAFWLWKRTNSTTNKLQKYNYTNTIQLELLMKAAKRFATLIQVDQNIKKSASNKSTVQEASVLLNSIGPWGTVNSKLIERETAMQLAVRRHFIFGKQFKVETNHIFSKRSQNLDFNLISSWKGNREIISHINNFRQGFTTGSLSLPRNRAFCAIKLIPMLFRGDLARNRSSKHAPIQFKVMAGKFRIKGRSAGLKQFLGKKPIPEDFDLRYKNRKRKLRLKKSLFWKISAGERNKTKTKRAYYNINYRPTRKARGLMMVSALVRPTSKLERRFQNKKKARKTYFKIVDLVDSIRARAALRPTYTWKNFETK